MNKIYKVVWSKVKNSYVVVSEVAKANGKSGVRSIAAVTAAAVLMSGGTALAADYTIGGTYDSISSFKTDTGFNALTDNTWYCNYYPVNDKPGESNHVMTDAAIDYTTTEANGNIGIIASYVGKKGTTDQKTDNPNNNTLTITHDVTINTNGSLNLYGSCIDGGADASYNSVAKGNTITIEDVTLTAGGHTFIGGALSNNGSNADVDSNTAILKDVDVKLADGSVLCVYGGEARGGSATNNEAIIENVTVENAELYGGFVFAKGGDASGNTITLTDATIGEGSTIAGGHVYDVEGKANDNTVNIEGDSKISGSVYGGISVDYVRDKDGNIIETNLGEAEGNTINISGNADISNASLYGDDGGEGTGNTLNLKEGWTGKTVGLAENFNEINVEQGVEADFTQGIKATEDLVVNAQDATVTIAGNADDGVKAVVYAAEGASLTINATNAAEESLVITNEGTASTGAAVLAKAAADTTEVTLNGNIDIDANGGRGINAKNGTAVDVAGAAVINVGDETTKAININNAGYGLIAQYNGTEINVKGEALNIDGGGAADSNGIWVMNGNLKDTDPSDNAKITIDKDTVTTITNVDSAIMGTSQGTVDIAGDLYATAKDEVIGARGGSTINVNSAGDENVTVQMKGDIVYELDSKDIHPVDATVVVNLANSDSWFEGNIYKNDVAIDAGSPTGDVGGMNLGLANGAQWTTKDSGTSFVNDLTMNDGIINQNSTDEITVDNLAGEGNVVFKSESGQINVMAADGATLNMSMAGEDADSLSTTEDLNTLANKLDVAEDATANVTGKIHVDEGLINGAIDMTVEYEDIDGDKLLNGIIKDVQHSASTTALNIGNVATNAAVAWRDEDATLSQRLGELRESEGSQGVWARMTQGEFERGSDFETEYNTLQIGYDKAKGDWHYGAAVSHSEGDTVYSAGSGEIDSTSLSVYGTWLGEKGHYKDIVAKIGVINNEYTINAANQLTKGDYDTVGTSISGEYGMKQDLGSGWYVNPLAKMTYMHIGSADYTTNNGINVKHKSVDSLIARLGAELGKQIGEKGDIYIKASALHDFGGDADTILRRDANSAIINDEIGGTWYEIGLGFNYKTSDATYLYADVIKTYGDEIRTPWQWNAGVRYSF